MEKKIKQLFQKFAEAKTLALIREEVEETSTEVKVVRKGVERKEIRRGRSEFVMDGIHDAIGNRHLDCKNAEGPCLNALVEQYTPLKIIKVVIDGLHVLIPALYTKLSVQASWFSTLNKTIQAKFADHQDVVDYSKDKLRLPKEARLLQQVNYNAKVVKANANLRELTDTKVLEVINQLRTEPDYISQICLVGLCVGSRISEICLVSNYRETKDNPRYITVIGVAKDRRARKGALPDEEEKKGKKKRRVVEVNGKLPNPSFFC
jgi:hypothetical protein